ncbi:hypothetical protein [Streptomyces sp. NPDC093970]|uniref:hypothetical protein n=1 Tax=unclassified Streptomyces TaxID=2593676 RepID=UPI0034331189
MANAEETESEEPGEPPDHPSRPEEPDHPDGTRLRWEHVQLIVDAVGVAIGLIGIWRGCGG